MRRQYSHRDEVKRGSDGIGEHFNQHSVEMGLDLKKGDDMGRIMREFRLVIVGQPRTQSRLDNLEADLQHGFQCLLKHGGMGKRDETKRKRNGPK